MRTVLFCAIVQRVVVFLTDVSGTINQSQLQRSSSPLPLYDTQKSAVLKILCIIIIIII